MIEPREIWHFDTRHVGSRVLVYDSLPSTNDLAHSLNEPGTAIVADVQTAGRGQYQRVWQSSRGASLLVSVTVAPPPELLRPVILIAWAAVAVRDTIRTLTTYKARIKWPNDLLIDGRKVCGILTESQRFSVVGIGLNLTQTAEDFAELPEATSLMLATGIDCEPAKALKLLLHALDDRYDRLLDGDRTSLEREWRQGLALTGKHVLAELSDGAFLTGRLIDVGFDGVEIDLGDGAIQAIAPEHVRHLAGA